MKFLLLAAVLLAVHCTLSQGSAVETLKRLLKRVEEKEAEQLKRHIMEKKKKEAEAEEEALLERLVEKLKSHTDKKGLSDFFGNVISGAGNMFDNAGDAFGNFGESVQDVLNIESGEEEDIELPDDLTTAGNTNPCSAPVLLQESSSGTIKFPRVGGDYPRWENCKWVLNGTASNKKIKIEFTSMDIKENGDCDDYVEILSMECKPYEDDDYRGNAKTGKLCAEGLEKLPEKKKSFTINSSCAYIHFRSNFFHTGKGFTLKYEFIK